jgi:hypothetical protein
MKNQPVLRPSANPFARRETVLPEGAPVALVLGLGENSPDRRRIVHGSAVGYAVRDPRFVDIGIANVRTWVHGRAITDVVALDPAHTSFFRIAIQGDLARTLAAVAASPRDGRSVIPAVEIPPAHCPNDACGAAVMNPYPFCGECGVRVSVGMRRNRANVLPPADRLSRVCAGCWIDNIGDGRFCPVCGFDRAAQEDVQDLAGTRVRLLITERKARRMKIEGTVLRGVYRRVYTSMGALLALKLTDIHVTGGGERDHTSSDFACWVHVHVADGQLKEIVGRLRNGTVCRASEMVMRCVHCDSVDDRSPRTRTRYCPRCGGRCRIAPAASEVVSRGGVNLPSHQLRHACGFVASSKHSFCGECGGSLADTHAMQAVAGRRGIWTEIAQQAHSDQVAAAVEPVRRSRFSSS